MSVNLGSGKIPGYFPVCKVAWTRCVCR